MTQKHLSANELQIKLRQEDKKRLGRSEWAMLLWMCNIKEKQHISTNSLLSQLKLKSLDSVLRWNRLCWFRHVKRSKLYTKHIWALEEEGNKSCGRPIKCWLRAIKDDLRQSNLQATTCQNRCEWRKGLKSAGNRFCNMILGAITGVIVRNKKANAILKRYVKICW